MVVSNRLTVESCSNLALLSDEKKTKFYAVRRGSTQRRPWVTAGITTWAMPHACHKDARGMTDGCHRYAASMPHACNRDVTEMPHGYAADTLACQEFA